MGFELVRVPLVLGSLEESLTVVVSAAAAREPLSLTWVPEHCCWLASLQLCSGVLVHRYVRVGVYAVMCFSSLEEKVYLPLEINRKIAAVVKAFLGKQPFGYLGIWRQRVRSVSVSQVLGSGSVGVV